MIPIKDNIPTRTVPIITMVLIFVNTIFFLWQTLALSPAEKNEVFHFYGLVPRELFDSLKGSTALLPYNAITLFTSMFLHGSFFHLGGNMLYLWIFGNNVEDAMGHKRFILFYLISGLAAAFFQFSYDPFSIIPIIGASGAVAGILGAYLVLYPRAKIKTLLIIVIFIKIVEIPAVLILTAWFLMQILYSQAGGVAWYAHIGGFVFGLLSIHLFRRTVRSRQL